MLTWILINRLQYQIYFDDIISFIKIILCPHYFHTWHISFKQFENCGVCVFMRLCVYVWVFQTMKERSFCQRDIETYLISNISILNRECSRIQKPKIKCLNQNLKHFIITINLTITITFSFSMLSLISLCISFIMKRIFYLSVDRTLYVHILSAIHWLHGEQWQTVQMKQANPMCI